MAYYPTFQPYGYQDQLNQLRTANPMPGQMPMQGFQQYPTQLPMQQPRQDSNGLIWVQGEAGAKSWFVAPAAESGTDPAAHSSRCFHPADIW